MKSNNLLRIILVLLTMMLSGCATAAVLTMDDIDTSKWVKVDSDSIIAVGTASFKSEDTKATERPQAVLVGLKYTYAMDKASEQELISVAEQLDGQYIQVNNGEEIRLEVSGWDEKKVKPTQLKSMLLLRYMKEAPKLTSEEVSALEKMGFKQEDAVNKYYSKQLTVYATLYPSANNLDDLKQEFKKQRNVDIYRFSGDSSTNPAKVILTPAAVAVDVVTSPIQIPALIYLVNNMKWM